MAAGRGRICMGIFLLALSLMACSKGQGEASREELWIPEYVAAINQVDLPDRVARDVYLCNGDLVLETYQMDGGSFYRQEYYTLSVSQPGAALEKFSPQFKGWSTVYDMVRDEQGNYYILEGDADYVVTDSEDRRMSGLCVCVYDAEGGCGRNMAYPSGCWKREARCWLTGWPWTGRGISMCWGRSSCC